MSLSDLLMARNRKVLFVRISGVVVLLLIAIGAMASNGWLPSTNPMSGQKTGWFGSNLPKNAPSSWNPLAAPLPSPTPQLSKEYIYAGSRLLAVEDANANAAPPADLAVWRPSTGVWYVLGGPGSSQTSATWGVQGDKPVPGDYDGDGKTDFSIFRPGSQVNNEQWYIIYSSNGWIANYAFGTTGDLPAQADYDGDGKTDAAVYRPSTYVWHIQGSTVGYYEMTWGGSSDIPASADYDGDGKADVAVWRPGNRTFYSIDSSNLTLRTVTTGIVSGTYDWHTVSGDYDGDGKADYAVYDRATAKWYIRSSISGTFPPNPVQWGASGDREVPNDYDGDGKVDIASWRNSNGNWYIRQSSTSNSLRQVWWGQSGDIPVPAFYRR